MEQAAVTPSDFARLEQKLDKLGDAVGKLVLVEERQTNQSARLDKHEIAIEATQQSLARLHARVDKWLYIGVGAWSIILGGFEIARFIFKG